MMDPIAKRVPPIQPEHLALPAIVAHLILLSQFLVIGKVTKKIHQKIHAMFVQLARVVWLMQILVNVIL